MCSWCSSENYIFIGNSLHFQNAVSIWLSTANISLPRHRWRQLTHFRDDSVRGGRMRTSVNHADIAVRDDRMTATVNNYNNTAVSGMAGWELPHYLLLPAGHRKGSNDQMTPTQQPSYRLISYLWDQLKALLMRGFHSQAGLRRLSHETGH